MKYHFHVKILDERGMSQSVKDFYRENGSYFAEGNFGGKWEISESDFKHLGSLKRANPVRLPKEEK